MPNDIVLEGKAQVLCAQVLCALERIAPVIDAKSIDLKLMENDVAVIVLFNSGLRLEDTLGLQAWDNEQEISQALARTLKRMCGRNEKRDMEPIACGAD